MMVDTKINISTSIHQPFEHVEPQKTSDAFQPNAASHNTKQSDSRSRRRLSIPSKLHKYFRKLFRFRQMDFEYALWQMFYLFVSPQKVYRNFLYRKQTKDHWARDDPAFLVLLSSSLLVSSIGFSLAIYLSFVQFIKFTLWVIFVDTIGVGLAISTTAWFLANYFMLGSPNHGQNVEWGYCFDVHLNALFPSLMILHFIQLPFLHWFLRWSRDFWPIFLGNTFWLVAVFYYVYITFLGYSSLPYLKKTQILLTPIPLVFIIYVILVHHGYNITENLCMFYETRAY